MPKDIKITLSDREASLFVTVATILASRGQNEVQAAQRVFRRGLTQEKARLSTYVWMTAFLKKLRREGVPDAAISSALASLKGGESRQ